VDLHSELDRVIPEASVLAAAHRFLDSAAWQLEFEGLGIVSVPRDPSPVVATRAFVRAHAPDVFLGDHFEASVLLGPEKVGGNWTARSGILKLFFDLKGSFISEDRYPPSAASVSPNTSLERTREG
jgi:hypothetical protein